MATVFTIFVDNPNNPQHYARGSYPYDKNAPGRTRYAGAGDYVSPDEAVSIGDFSLPLADLYRHIALGQ